MTARISSPSLGAASIQEKGTWTVAASHRWQYSDRHFVGPEEQKYREKEGSEVINDVHLIDLSGSYALTKRITATLSVPFQFATRSTTIRDGRTTDGIAARRDGSNLANPSGYFDPAGRMRGKVIDRYETSACGLSDLKLLGTTWLFDPETHKKQNISLGLGVLFPTGEKDVKDTFRQFATNAAGAYTPLAVTQNVDNSIQPGAGAWGIIFDLYAYKEVITNLTLFLAGTYIATPETDAGVIRGSLTAANPDVWSTGDSFLGRLGLGYTFLPKYGLTLTLGGRVEGTPSEDFIGHSGGERRPGYAVSFEPGLVFTKNRWTASFSAPVALYRNRTTTFGDDEPGDAAFADFMTLFTVSRSF